jgi:hypothetical protein
MNFRTVWAQAAMFSLASAPSLLKLLDGNHTIITICKILLLLKTAIRSTLWWCFHFHHKWRVRNKGGKVTHLTASTKYFNHTQSSNCLYDCRLYACHCAVIISFLCLCYCVVWRLAIGWNGNCTILNLQWDHRNKSLGFIPHHISLTCTCSNSLPVIYPHEH